MIAYQKVDQSLIKKLYYRITFKGVKQWSNDELYNNYVMNQNIETR